MATFGEESISNTKKYYIQTGRADTAVVTNESAKTHLLSKIATCLME